MIFNTGGGGLTVGPDGTTDECYDAPIASSLQENANLLIFSFTYCDKEGGTK